MFGDLRILVCLFGNLCGKEWVSRLGLVYRRFCVLVEGYRGLKDIV